MLQAEFVRDMHNNYIVLRGIEGKVSAYKTKMLLNNTMKGVLKTELRCIDHMDLFYYDITSKKSIAAVCDNKFINYVELQKILYQIIEIIEKSSEYLLSENDFIIDPNYIFVDINSQDIELCHLIGQEDNIKEQLSRFMEYLMNKVDYKDEAAVVLIYAMYKASKEPDCTFEKLIYELNIKSNEPKIKKIIVANENHSGNHSENHSENHKNFKTGENESTIYSNKAEIDKTSNRYPQKDSSKDNKLKNHLQNPKSHNSRVDSLFIKIQSQFKDLINELLGKNTRSVETAWSTSMIEEIESERETQYYGQKTYILAGLSLICGVIIFISAFQLKLLHNSFGTHIDITKLLCTILMAGCMETYLLIKIFDSKNKLIRIKTEVEYIKPNEGMMRGSNNRDNTAVQVRQENGFNQNSQQDEIYQNKEGSDDKGNDETQLLWTSPDDSMQDKTVILSQLIPQKQYHLIAIDTDADNLITVNPFPFIVGKLNKGVNLKIDDSSVSRRHARFTREGEEILLTDLNSTNGTFINGMKLTENIPYPMKDKDEISFSQVKYTWAASLELSSKE